MRLVYFLSWVHTTKENDTLLAIRDRIFRMKAINKTNIDANAYGWISSSPAGTLVKSC